MNRSRTHTLRNWALMLGGLAIGIAVGCQEDEDPAGGVAGFCESLNGFVSDCDEPSPCERALVRDCDPLGQILASAALDATTQCMNALGKPQECLADSLQLTPASTELEAFATAICLECSDGAGDCEDDVIGGDDDTELGRAGRIARILSADALAEVQDECTTGDACLANFEGCAMDVLAREVPGDSAECLVQAAIDNYDDSCGSDTVASSDTDSDTDSMSTSAGPSTSPTMPTDPTEGSDTEGGTDTDVCNTEGCGCDFAEDCLGELQCLDFICTSVVNCTDDQNEPNENEMQAALLPPINDDDSSQTSVAGELANPGDVDFFRYEGSDEAFAVVGPYAQVNINALELCIYAECTNGLENTEVSCQEGTTQQPSPGGRPGCCASNTSGFEIDLGCMSGAFGDDSALIYMSVTGSEPGICQEYSLTYHY